MTTATTATRRTLTASTPGGSACQFRVQERTANDQWHLSGTFRHRLDAEIHLAQLQTCGVEARIIAHRICPVSA
jgi:hypothetical protein